MSPAKPAIVEQLDYEQILASIKADIIARHPQAAEVINLESEPLAKLAEAFAYREMLYRARVNDAARAHLLAFATDTDLDHIGHLVGAARAAGEADERYRHRIALRIASLAAQGTAQHYEYVAMTASSNVRHAKAVSNVPGSVTVIIWQHTPDEATVQTVKAALSADGARMLGVTLHVAAAQPVPIHVTATITPAAGAPAHLLPMLQEALAQGIAQSAALGAGIARSYITTLLHTDNVQAVRYPDPAAPAEYTPMTAGQYPVLGTVNLTQG